MSEDTSAELAKLTERLEKHLIQHREDFDEYTQRQFKQDMAQEKNLEAISNLNKAVQPLVDGVTMFVVAQKLVKWLSGFAFLGGAIAWVVTFFTSTPVK